VITRIIGALARAVLVAILIALPAMILPAVPGDTAQIVLLLAILAAAFTFGEYLSSCPSIVEFRDAPPFNRIRFFSLFITVLMLTIIAATGPNPSPGEIAIANVGTLIGEAIDFPYSPVRLVVLMMPPDAPDELLTSVRTAAGMAYLVSLTGLAFFLLMVRVFDWPSSRGAFNVWINLPLFDPTAGGDVVARLKRDAQLNIMLGFLLPFLIPAIVKLATLLMDPITLADPQTLIWTISAWAFLPASLIMRGIAMLRIADMIEDKRRRTYARAKALQAA